MPDIFPLESPGLQQLEQEWFRFIRYGIYGGLKPSVDKEPPGGDRNILLSFMIPEIIFF